MAKSRRLPPAQAAAAGHFDFDAWGLGEQAQRGLTLGVYGGQDPLVFNVFIFRDATEPIPTFVEFGDLLIPSEFYAVWEYPDPQVRIALQMRARPDGPPICERVILKPVPGGPPITAASMRLPLQRLIQTSARRAALTKDEHGNPKWLGFESDDGESLWGAATSTGPGRGKRLEDSLLVKVANVYRAAIVAGQPPTRTVAEETQTSRSNAARYVGLARKKGFLEAAPAKGIGGEAKPKTRRKRG